MKKLICFLFNHKYRLLRTINNQIREVKCKRCGKEFAMDDVTQTILPLDSEFKEMHDWFINKKINTL